MKVLVAGCFSFPHGAATAGDLLARDLACEWIAQAGLAYDIAVAPPFTGGVDINTADPHLYSHAVFVCGPFDLSRTAVAFAERFSRCRLIGLDVTMAASLDLWNPFDVLIERDSARQANPDITFASKSNLVPLVGVCLVEDYGNARTHAANAAIERLMQSRDMAVVKIDTRLDVNTTSLRTPAEVETMLARMDVVITTRLHGTVLSLKHGVPVIAIDPEPGGAKIRRQATAIGWPLAFNVDALADEALKDAFAYCLTEDARAVARACAVRAKGAVAQIREEFMAALAPPARVKLVEERIPADHRWMSGAALRVGGALSFPLKAFKRQTGRLRADAIECAPGEDQAGYCLFGPDYPVVESGRYRAVFLLERGINAADVVIDVHENRQSGRVVAEAEVNAGGGGRPALEFDSECGDRLEFRVYWRGKERLKITGVTLERIG